MDGDLLSDLLVRAIGERRRHIDEIARDHPLEITFHYHPTMEKIDMVIRAVRQVPSWRVPRRRAEDRPDVV